MRDGKPDGYWKTYFESGLLKSEGNRVEFQLDGPWRFYNEMEVLTKEITYKGDIKHGVETRFSKDGFTISKDRYDEGMKSGDCYVYYKETDVVRSRIVFVEGKEQGIAYEYAKSDGRIIGYAKYDHGFLQNREKINRFNTRKNKQGVWKEFFEGTELIRSEGRFIDGKKNGFFREYDRKGVLINTVKYDNDEVVTNVEEIADLEIRREFHHNASLKSIGSYNSDGQEQGAFKEYTDQGELVTTKLFYKGILLGKGILDERGIKQGEWEEYYTGGSVKAKGEYKNGKKIEDWVYYFETGELEQRGYFTKAGQPNGVWQWYYVNGDTLRIENFRSGLEDGEFREYDRNKKIILEAIILMAKRKVFGIMN